MAESKRRGKDTADERLDDAFDDAADDDVLDEDDDDLDDVPVSGRRGGTAVKTRSKADSDKAVRVTTEGRVGIFGRIARFFREVVAELRKVIWPTRKELLTYATVVVVFVAVLMSIVALLDTGFAWAVLHVFGGGKK